MEWRDVWRVLFPRQAIDRDVSEELSFHVEERVRELAARGWDEDEARAHVLRRFGDFETFEEACRSLDEQRVDGEERRGSMEALGRDVRLAARGLARNPMFTLTVVVTLALGIGASTAVFGVLEAIVLRPLPFDGPDRLAMVWQNDRATGTVRENASTADYYDYVERSRAFDDLAMHALGTAVLTREGAPALQLNAASVSRNLIDVLRLDPQLGRAFTDTEDQPDGPRVVMLTDRVWNDLYGSDPTILGRSAVIDAFSHEVVGVLPPDFDYPAGDTDIWLPIRQAPTTATRPQHWIQVVGRLGPGVRVEDAQAEMAGIMADLEIEYPNDNVNRGAFVESLADVGRADVRTTLWVIFAAVMAVLAIACVNVANLLLARGAGRMKELAVLVAIGAGSGEVRRKFFAEAVLVTLMASLAGVALAAAGNRLLAGLAPAGLRSLGEPQLNLSVLAFALGVAAVVCLGFGLLPSLQARRVDVQKELKDGRSSGGRGMGLRLRRTLVAAQLSLAVTLLLGATLLIGTVRNLRDVNPGFEPSQALRVDFALPDSRYPDFSTYPDWPEIHAFLRSLEDETEAVPGVRSVGIALNHPLDPGFTNSFQIEGEAYDPTQGEMSTRLVTPGYFGTAGLALQEGRLLDESDRVETTPVVVLNRTAADRYFPAGDAIGRRLGFWGSFREVVGIVDNERLLGLAAEPPPAMYVTMYQSPPRGGKITLMARTDVAPRSVVEGIRSAVQNVDADVPVFNVATMEETLDEAMGRERFASTVLVLFAGVAVFLAVLGVHGVLAYLVAQRAHEIGVRMALGATRHDVVRMIVRQGAVMTALGIVGGFALFLGASGALQGMIYGVSATAPWIYVAVAATLGSAAMLGSALPAFRAASIDPMESLRGE